MQCKQIDDLMMKYFDGNISELEVEQLMRHHQKCKTCAEEFEVLREALFEIEDLPDIEPTVELTAHIMTAIQSQKHLVISKKMLISWIVGFVGLVFFTYNIIAFSILPMISGGVNLLSAEGMMQLANWAGELVKDGVVLISVSVGKLMVIRNLILTDYTVLIFIWAVAFAAVEFMLYKLINMKKKRNDFVHYN